MAEHIVTGPVTCLILIVVRMRALVALGGPVAVINARAGAQVRPWPAPETNLDRD
jgi:hypothetical protein